MQAAEREPDNFVPLTPHVLTLAEAVDLSADDLSRAAAELAGEIAEELELGPQRKQDVELATLMRDVGRSAVMEEIAYDPDGLAPSDLDVYLNHPLRAEAMLRRLGDAFAGVATIVRSCNERFDGTGYPDRLSGEEIPIEARIVNCADAYEGLTSDRPYTRRVDGSRAVAQLWGAAGSELDPDVVSALVRVKSRSRATGPQAVPVDAPEAPAENRPKAIGL